MIFLVMLSTLLLFLLSIIHIYWTFGGTWGSNAVIPKKKNGIDPIFTPRRFETLAVASLLLISAFFPLIQGGYLNFINPNLYTKWISIIIGVVFVIRSIGDFKYVGFFKKIKGSTFAVNDTLMYSPLCIVLGIIFIVISI
jgi:hypothetical protein